MWTSIKFKTNVHLTEKGVFNKIRIEKTEAVGMMRLSVAFIVVCGVTAGAVAATCPTLTCTGEAGDSKWLTAGSWTSDSGTPDPRAINNYILVDR